MKHVSADRAEHDIGNWLAVVATGESVSILDGGMEVAQIVPPNPLPDHLLREQARRVAFAKALQDGGLERLKELRAGLQYTRVPKQPNRPADLY